VRPTILEVRFSTFYRPPSPSAFQCRLFFASFFDALLTKSSGEHVSSLPSFLSPYLSVLSRLARSAMPLCPGAPLSNPPQDFVFYSNPSSCSALPRPLDATPPRPCTFFAHSHPFLPNFPLPELASSMRLLAPLLSQSLPLSSFHF